MQGNQSTFNMKKAGSKIEVNYMVAQKIVYIFKWIYFLE